MGLTNKKEQQLRQMPAIQSRIKTSKNGRFVISQTIITNVKPIEYYKAIVANTVKQTTEPLTEEEFLLEDDVNLLRRLRVA